MEPYGAGVLFNRLNADQRQALDWTRSISIRANAGSGKTSVLIERVVQILHADFQSERSLTLERIVAITFTRKAAAQLRSKLRDALTTCFNESAGDEQVYWQSRLDELPNCAIGTIDSLCHRLLQGAIAEGLIEDLDPAFGILQGIDRTELLDLAITRLEQQIGAADADTQRAWHNWLRTQGRDEIERALKTLLNGTAPPIACGHALDLFEKEGCERVLELLRLPQLTEPLQFFRANPSAWKQRVAAVMAELNGLPRNDQQLVSVRAMKDGLDEVLLTSGSIFNVIANLRKTLLTNNGTARTRGLVTNQGPRSRALHSLIEEWLPLLSGWSFENVATDGLDLTRQLVLLYDVARRHFHQLCNEENRYDFNYLAEKTLHVLQKENNAQRLAGHFRYLLVDEFQDTNDLQWRIIARVAGEDPSSPVLSDKLMIVGDPQQSIYRFRQADPTVFSRIIDLIRRGNTEQQRQRSPTAFDQHLVTTAEIGRTSTDEERLGAMRLPTNYRSHDPTPLRWLDRLSAYAFSEVGYENYQPLVAGKFGTEQPTEVVYLVPDEPDQPATDEAIGDVDQDAPSSDDSTNAYGEKTEEAADDTVEPPAILDNNQLQLVATELRLLHQSGRFAWKEMAILLRSRRTHLTNLETTLREHGIPYQLVGGIGFWQRQEVRDLISLTTCLANRGDELALFAVLRGPMIGLDDSELLFLHTLGKRRLGEGLQRFSALMNGNFGPDLELDQATLEALRIAAEQITPERKFVLERAVNRIGKAGSWRQRADRMPHADLLRAALDESGAWAIYAAEADGDRALANIRMLLEEVQNLETNRPGCLADVARRLKLLVDEATQEEQAELTPLGGDGVQIMTVHAAKGLEFKVVAVIGLERQIKSDHSPIWLLDRFQHLSGGHQESDLAKHLHGLPVLRFRDLNMPLRKIKPILHQALSKSESELTCQEEARIFHVAITRAEQVLLLAGSSKWKKNCWQEWVHQAFELPLPFQEGPMQAGEDMRFRVVRRRQALGAAERPSDDALPFFDLQPLLEAPRRHVISATELFSMLATFERSPEDWKLRYMHRVRPSMGGGIGAQSENPDHGRLIGTLVHRALEMGKFLPADNAQRRDYLMAQAAALVKGGSLGEDAATASSGGDWQAIARAAETILKHLEPVDCFRDLLALPGDSEVDFDLVIGQWNIVGRFDRLIGAADGSEQIVDWKTESSSPQRIVEQYRDQMKLYALALFHSLPEKKRPQRVVVHLALTHHHKVEQLIFELAELKAFARELEVRLEQTKSEAAGKRVRQPILANC